jgi:hypothetical protein
MFPQVSEIFASQDAPSVSITPAANFATSTAAVAIGVKDTGSNDTGGK